jgi:hypothetical protein
MRSMGTPFQGAKILAIEAPLPTIEGLPANPKMMAGVRHTLAIEVTKQHPLQPVLGGPAQLPPPNF